MEEEDRENRTFAKARWNGSEEREKKRGGDKRAGDKRRGDKKFGELHLCAKRII